MGSIFREGAALVVNALGDHDDGICGGSDCTLREAIHRANGSGGAHTITFGGGIAGTITLSGSELDVSGDLTIMGPGARALAVSGNSASRVLMITSGTSSISGLTIENGRVVASAGQTAQGGGIYTNADLTLTDCAFTGNVAVGGNGFGPGASGGKGQGGAIYNAGGLTLTGCTFSSGNMATGGNGLAGFARQPGGNGGAGQGGALFNANDLASLTNCSFYANTARGGNGGNGSFGGNGGAGNGGGVGNAATLTMTACTLESNFGGFSSGGTGSSGNGAAGVASGGITNISGGTATVTDTISWNNVANGGGGVDVDGAFTSGGYNLLGTGDHSTGFTATGDMKGTDASPLNAGVIGPPSNTGGPTDTFTLASNSLAIDASSNAVAPHRDQRGYLRTGRPDIGAFESNGSLLNLVSVGKNSFGFVVGAEVVQGKVYRLERKLNITEATWQSISGITDLTATGNDTEFLNSFDAGAALSHAFYHVIFIR